jgi:hypothetical protein
MSAKKTKGFSELPNCLRPSPDRTGGFAANFARFHRITFGPEMEAIRDFFSVWGSFPQSPGPEYRPETLSGHFATAVFGVRDV